jgi:PAS domain S-box-containing protein
VVHPTPPETPGSPPPLADLAELRRGVHYEAPLSVGGRPWLALVRPLTSPAHVLWNWRIWMVLLMGLALSAALLVYLRARQRSDASLREAEEHYRGLFDSAPAMYVTARVEDGLPIVTDCNALFLRALGYAREEVIGRLLTEFHSGPSRKELIEAYETALRGQAIEGERELLTRTGALIPVMMRGDPIFDAERAVIGTRKMYVDISERKHAEDEFRLVVESAPNGMLMLDENGVITLVNTQMEILFGYRREDLLGQSIEILVPQRFRASHPGQREQFFNDPKARMMGHGRELFGLKSDGTEFPVEVGLNPITSSHGLQVLASVIDISERKRSEDALRQSEATTAMLIDSAPDAMLALDELGQIVRVNRQTEEMFGYAREELLGKRIKELLGPRILDLFQERKDAAAHAPGSRFFAAVEVAGRHKDGGEFATDVTLNPLDMGGWRLFMVTVRDIRHRKAAEVSIRQLTDTLEERVAARTADLKREVSERETVEKALKETNAQFQLSMAALEKRNQEVTLLSAMIQMVECCRDADEAYQVMARHLRRLFPLHPGAIYMISASRNLIECAARWDDDTNAAPALTFTPKDCWALRRGRIYKVESPLAEMLCEHVEVGNELPGPYICAPLIAHSEALGILHLKYAATNCAAEPPDSALLQTVAEQLSLVVGNLRLRETLSQQNIRDPLTGLFNRRYMEESLQRDLQRAKRSGNSLTIAMVDVDHFKRFNDSFGHAAGDVVSGVSSVEPLEDKIFFGSLRVRLAKARSAAAVFGAFARPSEGVVLHKTLLFPLTSFTGDG